MPNRIGAAVIGAAALLVATAAPATADAVTGKADSDLNVIGYQVNVGDDWLATIPTNLLGFTLSDGTQLGMYCVEVHTDIDEEHDMVERPWADYPSEDSPFNENRAKINWVLHHGYPAKSIEALTAQFPDAHDGIDTLEAIAATQAAVWHYSDGTDLNRDDPLSGDGSDEQDAEDALALYDYLTGAENTGIGEQPTPTLSVSPAELSGASGERIGPFTVTTSGTIEELSANLPDGVKLTDVDGTELTTATIADGTELYLDVPAGAADGDGSFELKASAAVDTGRLFVGQNYDEHPTQSLIVAKSEKTTLTAGAGAEWTAAPTTPPTSTTTTTTTTTTVPPTTTTTDTPAPQPKNDDLAETGASVFAPILIGLVLVGAGIGAMFVVRRRKRA
ncbi:thioester domain-containing protein [Actinophytocola algeriensis]|uniref:TQXA domain-containing protein/LPXTG-motif cell wall-anchored protein n=1 Tax=Actinophytocola algeriensis TaxID=1768010 RepID=A0A7W7QFH5_9PSEU|nr:thioester domain-containing protein [Actinophytocola algeriensis]MBB4912549.1 TQXA domain-containing protein/LPXTG-motif cell wall-anchored protein [Actinophytocola algeriensis]MBE1478923.1 TQXA domain-containing protein/LPXTG-motif cell wall-anchored protein [Actinophytocola algeriensis]